MNYPHKSNSCLLLPGYRPYKQCLKSLHCLSAALLAVICVLLGLVYPVRQLLHGCSKSENQAAV
jgi:hypothetical protein